MQMLLEKGAQVDSNTGTTVYAVAAGPEPEPAIAAGDPAQDPAAATPTTSRR
jgi:hypothetical protein